ELGVVLLLAGTEAATGVRHREGERLGDEDVLHDDVVRTGATEADHVPDVDNLVLVARDEERLEVDDVPFLVEHEAAEQDPAGVCRAGGEGPLAGQRVAALGEY